MQQLTCGRLWRSTARSIACAAWQFLALTFHSLQAQQAQRAGQSSRHRGSAWILAEVQARRRAAAEELAVAFCPRTITATHSRKHLSSPDVLNALPQVVRAHAASQALQNGRPLALPRIQRLAHHRQQAARVAHLKRQGCCPLVVLILLGSSRDNQS